MDLLIETNFTCLLNTWKKLAGVEQFTICQFEFWICFRVFISISGTSSGSSSLNLLLYHYTTLSSIFPFYMMNVQHLGHHNHAVTVKLALFALTILILLLLSYYLSSLGHYWQNLRIVPPILPIDLGFLLTI